MLPSPRIATWTRTGSPAATLRPSTVVVTWNWPTAPSNAAGAPSGRGRTSIVTAGAVTSRSSVCWRNGAKKGANGSEPAPKPRVILTRSTSNSIGASSSVPERVGKRATRRMVTASYGWPSTVAGRGYVEGTSISSRHAPAASHVPIGAVWRGWISGSKYST